MVVLLRNAATQPGLANVPISGLVVQYVICNHRIISAFMPRYLNSSFLYIGHLSSAEVGCGSVRD